MVPPVTGLVATAKGCMMDGMEEVTLKFDSLEPTQELYIALELHRAIRDGATSIAWGLIGGCGILAIGLLAISFAMSPA
jgi:hypothetical protein